MERTTMTDTPALFELILLALLILAGIATCAMQGCAPVEPLPVELVEALNPDGQATAGDDWIGAVVGAYHPEREELRIDSDLVAELADGLELRPDWCSRWFGELEDDGDGWHVSEATVDLYAGDSVTLERESHNWDGQDVAVLGVLEPGEELISW
jgi:hypothetical protein